MKKQLDYILTGAMIVAALGLTGNYFFRSKPVDPRNPPSHRLSSSEWKRVVDGGRVLSGSTDAADTIAVFTDLQCPVCKVFHLGALDSAMITYPKSVRVVLVHYPLSYHKQAMAMARATECIDDPIRLQRWLDYVYEKQDSLPFLSAAQLANGAGIADTAKLLQCALDRATEGRVNTASALGDAVGVRGTPTVVVNGLVFGRPPRPAQLDSALRSARRGEG